MLGAPAVLVRAASSWADAYSNSKLLATLVTFVHIAGLLMAGGLAVATDRSTLRALRLAAHERSSHLDELAGVHRLVVTGLALSLVSGVLLFAADVETFFGSWLFWSKLVLVAVLLANGYRMTRAEQALRTDAREDAAAWRHLRRAALASMVLWYVIALAGVGLVTFA